MRNGHGFWSLDVMCVCICKCELTSVHINSCVQAWGAQECKLLSVFDSLVVSVAIGVCVCVCEREMGEGACSQQVEKHLLTVDLLVQTALSLFKFICISSLFSFIFPISSYSDQK